MSRRPEANIQQIAYRELLSNVWQPSSEDKARAMKLVYPALRRDILGDIRTKPAIVKTRLSQIRQEIERRGMTSLSRPNLTAQFIINDVVDYFRNMADKNMAHGLHYAFWFDTAFAMDIVLTTVPLAEASVAKDQGEHVVAESDLMERSVGMRLDIGAQAEEYVRQSTEGREFFSLLGEDQTGYLLITEAAKRARRQPSRLTQSSGIPPFYVGEFVDAGASLAEELYAAVYPLIAPPPAGQGS